MKSQNNKHFCHLVWEQTDMQLWNCISHLIPVQERDALMINGKAVIVFAVVCVCVRVCVCVCVCARAPAGRPSPVVLLQCLLWTALEWKPLSLCWSQTQPRIQFDQFVKQWLTFCTSHTHTTFVFCWRDDAFDLFGRHRERTDSWVIEKLQVGTLT